METSPSIILRENNLSKFVEEEESFLEGIQVEDPNKLTRPRVKEIWVKKKNQTYFFLLILSFVKHLDIEETFEESAEKETDGMKEKYSDLVQKDIKALIQNLAQETDPQHIIETCSQLVCS